VATTLLVLSLEVVVGWSLRAWNSPAPPNAGKAGERSSLSQSPALVSALLSSRSNFGAKKSEAEDFFGGDFGGGGPHDPAPATEERFGGERAFLLRAGPTALFAFCVGCDCG